MNYLFPISYMSITQAMTAMVIGLAVLGKPEMAAEISVVHGATLATFYAFSANFRNMILYGEGQISVPIILFSRIVILIPLAIIAFILCVYLAGINSAIASVLIIRRCVEWINEVHLCETEVKKDDRFALMFLILQSVLLIAALGLSLKNETYTLAGLALWAVLPILPSLRFVISKKIPPITEFKKLLPILLPHFGSTAIIGFSFYVFRLIIFLIAGKTVAGDLFAAIAVGSFMGSIFANVVGPSIALHEVRTNDKYSPLYVKAVLYMLLFLGFALVIAGFTRLSLLEATGKNYFFWMTAGFSLVGGVIMVKAQTIKLVLLKYYEEMDIFGPDMLIHILLIASVPCLYFVRGVEALSVLYLLNAVLSYMFYFSAKRYLKKKDQTKLFGVSDTVIRFCIAFFLFFPLFFQLSGRIFHSHQLVLDSGGIIFQLPLPISIIGCYFGLLFIGRYKKAYLSLTVIFLLFILMVLTSIITADRQIVDERYKLLLLFQYMLPVFGLVLGQLFENGMQERKTIEKAFLVTVICIVPLQLLLTRLGGMKLLTHNMLVFSIYQHHQYVTLAMICGFLISLWALWEIHHYRKILIFMAPLICVYSVAGFSMLALFLAIAGLSLFAAYMFLNYRNKTIVVVWACSLIIAVTYFSSSWGPHGFKKYNFLKETRSRILSKSKPIHSNKIMPSGLQRRFEDWNLYGKAIIANGSKFLWGHAKPFDRAVTTSAHNYYLDFLYNFGAVALLPILFLIGYSVQLAWKHRQTIIRSERLLGLCVVVFFMLLVDNNFKVTLRQPYSGIMVFFLWGVLLTRLQCLKKATPSR
ncbi:MAG: hypothetical protein SWH54_18885 [Thermodesulfobacteriota bacterium]|nr:hypothetical protein [Thermodesulfobacteriota bacterium]